MKNKNVEHFLFYAVPALVVFVIVSLFLFRTPRYVADKKDDDINIVQLVSFGCGVDAITTDEMRSILERGNRIYTQIKIDEISNPGAVKIRLRSLFAATGR